MFGVASPRFVLGTSGYLYVNLSDKNKPTNIMIHRIIGKHI
jgi:hypothetical protein